jgi:sec-independent protein translocase protein TatA
VLTNFAFLDISTPELLIILVIILLLFGSKKLPQLTRSISDSVKELRGGMSDGNKDGTKAAKTKEEDSSQPEA